MIIPVNRPYQPPFAQYQHYLQQAFDRNWLTNNGPLCQLLKARLEEYLGVENLLLVANGTLAMQLAYRALDVKGQAITTPFTFIASSSSLHWEGITPHFADIDERSFNLSPAATAAMLSSDAAANVSAIVPVHVYGNPCDVQAFEQLSEKHKVKVIYDAAHAFGIQLGGRSVLGFGDAATLSFHATKVFHTVEGGAVIFRDKEAYQRAERMINFGIDSKDGTISGPGINCKMSEVHAAMGLAVLDNIEQILEKRQFNYQLYLRLLSPYLQTPHWSSEANSNGAYFPILCPTAAVATRVMQHLAAHQVTARRYFAPSINTLETYQSQGYQPCPVSEDYACRTLCLPLYYDLSEAEIHQVAKLVLECL